MRSATILLLMALTVLICGLFLNSPSVDAKNAVSLDSQAHVLEFSKSVPGQLNYQGFLANTADSSAVTATLEMTFRLFDTETKGAELWSETHPAVEVRGGLFQVLLGSITPFPDGLFDGSSRWLQTEVGTEILSPRKPLASVAYSQRAQMADHAMISDESIFAAEAHHAVLADTAAYSPSAGAWTVSGEDVYRETGKVGVGTASPLTELDVSGSVNATTYYGDGSNLTGISGTADSDWTISGNHMYSAVPGSVGVGTSSPEKKLHVAGEVKATAYYGDGSNLTGISGNSDNDWTIAGDTVYHETGPVGIGTTTPTAPLTIQAIAGDEILFPGSGNNIDVKAQGEFRIGTLTTSPLHLLTENNFRLTVAAGDGHVGIGTTLPYERLHLHDNAKGSCYTQFTNTATGSGSTDGFIVGINTDGGAFIYNRESLGNIYLGTSNNTRMFIHNTGKVGIGTITPAYDLEVNGSAKATAYYGDGSNLTGISGTTDNDWTISGSDMYAGVSGNVGIGVASPVKKLDVAGDLNLNRGISSGIALWVNGDEALWYNGTYFSWGHGGTANYFADDVGIGTSNPANKLDVKGAMAVGTNYSGVSTAPSNGMIVEGNVGIGTNSPSLQNKLEVTGGSSYSIHATYNGAGGGAAISATNSGTGGDAIQATASGSGRSAIYATGSAGVDYAVYSSAGGADWAGAFFSSDDGVQISTPAGRTGLTVLSGTKNAAVRTDDGSRLLYCEESTEVWFSDHGFGRLKNGQTMVDIDPLFAQTVSLDVPYHVFVQVYGDAEVYVTERTADHFEVHLRDGDPNVEFSYRIMAKRAGYEETRLERAPWADNDPNLYPEKQPDQ